MASMRRHYGGWGHVVRKDLWGRHILPEGDKKSSQMGCYALGSKSQKEEKSEALCPRICVSRIRKVSKINVYPIVKSTVKGQRSKGGGGDQGLLLPWSMRLDVLKFSGDDLDRWILAIMEYFSLLNTPADQRLRIVGFNLEGLGTVEDYQREFEKLMNRVTDIPNSLLIYFYISGLKLNLQHELLVSRPTTLYDAFSLARIIKSRSEAIAEKKQNIKEKADTTLSLPIEEVSPVVKGPLDVSEDTLLSLRSLLMKFVTSLLNFSKIREVWKRSEECYTLGSGSQKKEKSEVLCPRIYVTHNRKVSKVNVYPIVKSKVKG
ncbi:hypothetical protein Tco_1089541 [Tanacetum coccineum]